MLHYARLSRHPRVFRALTGLTTAAFDDLARAAVPALAAADQARLSRPGRRRAPGAGPPPGAAPPPGAGPPRSGAADRRLPAPLPDRRRAGLPLRRGRSDRAAHPPPGP